MSEEKLLRLPVVAKEFNVSVNTIIDHLKGKGFDVNPASKATAEMYNLLKVAFAKDAEIKVKAEQISLSKGNREDIVIGDAQKKAQKLEDEQDFLIKDSRVTKQPEKAAEKPVAKKEEPKPEPPVAPPVVEEPVKAPEPVAEAPAVVAPAADDEVQKATPTKMAGPKIMGKIDLNSPAAKGKATKAKKEEPAPEPTPAPAAEEVAAPVAKTTKAKKAAEKEAEPAPTPEPVAEAPVAPPVVETPPVVEAPEENFRRTEKHTLTGPKIIGKIELPAKQERPAATPAKPAEGAGSADSKRRRKRVKLERIPLKDNPGGAGAGGGTGTGGTPKVEGHRAGQSRDHRAAMPGREGHHNRPVGAPGFNPLIKTEVSEKEIQEKIKNTLAKLGGGGGGKGKARAKLKRAKRDDRAFNEQERADEDAGKLQVTEFISVSELASLMNVSATEVISKCMQLGVIVSINQRLDAEVIELVASEFNFEAEFINVTDKAEEAEEDDVDAEEDLTPRAPIVTVMGHVDHGKTSLLDYIRKANVVSKEAGGITQHIGAYEVTNEEGKKVVFLDTPGHEAFTAMRARGAKVTDVAIIVIAADDQVMPQTKEAISHAQAAGVPMIFAYNKMDKEGANPDNIRQQLSQMNILVEEWGGKFQSQEISAKKGINIDKLLEKVLLEAELLDLKANSDKPGRGTVIEASLDKGRGYITTVLVSSGTLRQGDMMVAGTNYGKIKAMFNEKGVKVREAGPSTAVLILGLDGAPQAGDIFKVYENESEAKTVTNQRQQIMREQGLRTRKHITLDEIGRRLALGTFKELNVIIKGDFDGSVQALKDSLHKLSTSEVQVNIVHSGVGQITESDVLLASASDAVILGFQVRPSSNARKLADKENIEIRLYSIIYDAIEEIKTAMEGMLSPKIEETITGMAEVREVFKITNVGTVAGCVVTEGKIVRGSKVRLIRDGIVVFSGEMAALKRFKDDVKDVIQGQDCGISIKNFSDIQNGDNIEGYTEIEVKRKL